MKLITYGEDAKQQLRAGVSKLADAVASTMGPGGNPVILDNVMGDPIITADGVTVSEEVELLEAFAQTGVALVKSVARQTNQEAGDGTTTSIVLARAIIEHYYQLEANQNSKKPFIPFHVKKGMQKAYDRILEKLDELTVKIEDNDRETLARIATISARGDREMGELIADAFIHSGMNGQVLLEEGRSKKSSVELITGYQLDRGVYRKEFVNDAERGMCVLNKPLVVVFKQPQKDRRAIIAALEWAMQNDRPLVMVAPEIEEIILATLITNNIQSSLSYRICFVEAPDFGDKQELLMEDLAFMVGAKLVDETTPNYLSEIATSMGTCETFMATKSSSVFINNLTEPSLVTERIKNLKDEVSDEKFLELRKARLHGRLAKLVVGADSVVEMKEKRDRVEDALNATKAAIEEGFIPGGGVTLLNISDMLLHETANNAVIDRTDLSLQTGFNTMCLAIQEPAFQIILNVLGDRDETNNYVSKLLELKNHEMGYDVRSMDVVNLVETGVIDPVKVTKMALKAAYSVASTIISTNCVIAVTGESGDLRL